MDAPKPPQHGPAQLTVKISDETHRGLYANRVIIAHSGEEFVLDFVADLPPGPQVVSRIITSPSHAVALVEALSENIGRYQAQYGPIRRPGAPPKADA